jgi:AraC-like DNA-binding protein
MKLYIKYMLSISCKAVVREEITKLGLHCRSVNLGEAEIEESITTEQYGELNVSLKQFGLELMQDAKSILIEKIKRVIIELVYYDRDSPKIKFSEYLSQTLNYNYTYLSNLFSATQSTTIVDFMIVHKIERAKQLLVYNELNLTEISWKLNYSSVAHLSNQFKKVTGLTPSLYKSLRQKVHAPQNA